MASEDRHLLRQRHLFSLSVNGRNLPKIIQTWDIVIVWELFSGKTMAMLYFPGFGDIIFFGLRPISCEEAGHPITLDDIHRKSDKHLSKPKASQYAMSMQRTLPSLFVEVFRRASISNTYLCQSVGRSVSS